MGLEESLATRRERRQTTNLNWVSRIDDIYAEEAIKRKN
jgi:hypothetical protein